MAEHRETQISRTSDIPANPSPNGYPPAVKRTHQTESSGLIDQNADPGKESKRKIEARDSWENALQRQYPRACGSCAYSGAPGYCAQFLDEKNWATKCELWPNCGEYIPNNATSTRLKALAAAGMETGDAFTINMQSHELVEHGACPSCSIELELKMWRGTVAGIPRKFWLGYCMVCHQYARGPFIEV